MIASHRYVKILSLLVITTLLLSACNTGSSAGGTQAPDSSSSTDAPVIAAPACPYGKWQVNNFDSYMQSVMSNINNMQTEATVTNTGTSGTAYITFNEDGSGSFTAENFVNNFTMSFSAGDTTMDLPVILTQNGTTTAHFTIDGDKITLDNQDLGDYVITINLSGNVTNLDTSVLGTPGTTQLYQFSCPDINTLLLKVIAVDNMDLDPLTFTRVE